MFLTYITNFLCSIVITTVLNLAPPICMILLLPFYFWNKPLGRVLYKYYGIVIMFEVLKFFRFRIEIDQLKDFKALKNPDSCLIISNHTDNLDAIVLTMVNGQNSPSFFAKKVLSFVPYFDEFIFLSRNGMDRDFVNKAAAVLENGKPVAVFPEGTRVKEGQTVPYSKSVALMARRLKCPVVLYALNIAKVYSKYYGLKLIDVSKTMKAKFIEVADYEKIVFKVFFNGMKKGVQEDFSLKYSEAINLLESLSYTLHGNDEENIFTRLSYYIKIVAKTDPKILIRKLEDLDKFIAFEVHPELNQSTFTQVREYILKGYEVMSIINKTPNSEKDTAFTNYLEETIRSVVADI